VRLVGYLKNKSITMHGNMNVKFFYTSAYSLMPSPVIMIRSLLLFF